MSAAAKESSNLVPVAWDLLMCFSLITDSQPGTQPESSANDQTCLQLLALQKW